MSVIPADSGRCSLCMAKVDEDGISIEGTTYHETCFTCLKCSVALDDNNFGEISILGPMCKDHVKNKKESEPAKDKPPEDKPPEDKPPEDKPPERPKIEVSTADEYIPKSNEASPAVLSPQYDDKPMVNLLEPHLPGNTRSRPASQVFTPKSPQNPETKVDTPLFDNVDGRLKMWEDYEGKEEAEINLARYQLKKKILKDITLYEKKPYRYRDSAVQCNTCKKWLQPEFADSHSEAHPTLIYPRMFLGDELDAQKRDELDMLGIKHVLNVADYCGPFHKEHFNYLHLHIDDIPRQTLLPFFDQVFEFLDGIYKDPDSGSVLVHCIMGVSRSAALCVAYIMREEKVSLSKALEDVRRVRKCVNPNYGFLTQLVEYDIELNGSSDFRIDVWRRSINEKWK